MKFPLALKNVLLILSLILFSVGSVGYYLIDQEQKNLIQTHIIQSKTEIVHQSVKVQKTISEAVTDINFLSKVPAIQGIIRARAGNGIDPLYEATEVFWRERLNEIFESYLNEKTQYLKIQYVGIEDKGREIVRVDRMVDSTKIVGGKQLQQKGDLTIFKDAIMLPKGKSYISPALLARDFGNVVKPYTAEISVVTPIYDLSNDKVFGVVIISLNFSSILNSIINSNSKLRIVDRKGEYLAHPDARLTFGFEFGENHLIQNDYPALKEFFNDKSQVDENTYFVKEKGEEKIVYFIKQRFDPSDGSRFFGFAFIGAVSEILESLQAKLNKILYFVAGVLTLAIAVGFYFSRRLTKPLEQIAEITSLFGSEGPNEEIKSLLPSHLNDEIGGIARAFETMMARITDREDNLKRSTEYVQTLLNSSVGPIVTIDQLGTIDIFNPAAEQTFGYSASEIMGKNIKLLMPEPYRSEHDRYLKNYLSTGKAKIIGIGREVEGLRKDGTVFPLELAVSEIVFKAERRFVGICRDITQRKKSEESLRRSMEITQKDNWMRTGLTQIHETMRGEQTLDGLAQNIINCLARRLDAKVGALFLHEDGKLQLSGKYAYVLREGIPDSYKIGEGLVGQAALERKSLSISNVPSGYIRVHSGLGSASPKHILVTPLLHQESVVGVMELGFLETMPETHLEFLNFTAEAVAINIVTARSRAQMKELLLETQSQAEELRSQQEEMARAQMEVEQANANLIEQQKHLIRQKSEIEKQNVIIEEKAKQLELASKYKSEFLANMSHELRTPLNSMLILSKILAENKDGNLTPKQIEFTRTVYGSGVDLLNLINDILDLSKVESGNMETHIHDVEIEQWLQGYINKFQPVANEKDLYLNVKWAEGTPSIIHTDPARLDQVIKNLLSNSFKFTATGGVTLQARSLTAGENNRFQSQGRQYAIAISVSDTGKGISGERQEQIFEAFQQEDGSISRKYGGTGLGLSISKAMVKLLGGEISLASEPGKGSTFTVFLPQGEPSVQSTYSEPKEDETPLAVFKEKNGNMPEAQKRVLIIEDDVKFAQVIKHIADQKGYECLMASAGEYGVAMAKSLRPGAICLDIGLPGINGLEVMKILKGDPRTRDIPIIVVSVQGRENEARQLGALEYLEKPVTAEQLVGAFDQLEQYIVASQKNILLVEDSADMQKSIAEVFQPENVNLVIAGSVKDAEANLNRQAFDCMILDLGLSDMTGYDLLEKMKYVDWFRNLPIIIFTGRDLTREEANQLGKYSKAIIIKTVGSLDRLLEETRQCIYNSKKEIVVIGSGPKSTQSKEGSFMLEGKKILLVDDDIRNIYALTHILETEKVRVEIGKNGREALEKLGAHSDIQMVLMDIMMPVMDGITAIKEIRKNSKHKNLPIIALTAKAMKGDREKCLNAGASDYLIKPVDPELLLATVQNWFIEKNR